MSTKYERLTGMVVGVDDKEVEKPRATNRRRKRGPCECVTCPIPPYFPASTVRDEAHLGICNVKPATLTSESKDGDEGSPIFCPNPARTAVSAARPSSASRGNALVANMVIVHSVCVLGLP